MKRNKQSETGPLDAIVVNCLNVAKTGNRIVCRIDHKGDGDESLSRLVQAYQSHGPGDHVFELRSDESETVVATIVNFSPGFIELLATSTSEAVTETPDLQ